MKWEDNIKEKLEKRTIKPSDKSWNALADQLDAADKSNSKTAYWWMGVAASVVAMVFTVTVFINGNTIEIQKPTLVDTQEEVDKHPNPMEKLPQHQHVAETDQDAENLEPVKKSALKKKRVKKQTVLMSSKENATVAKNEKGEPLKPLQIGLQNEVLEYRKVSEIVAQIHDLQSTGQTVTDAEIDALLIKAQREINYQSIISEGSLTVDANALLQGVESELRHTFREKIFEALKTSYETVKTAVAERNN